MIKWLIDFILETVSGLLLMGGPPASLVFLILEHSKFRAADQSDPVEFKKRKKMVTIAACVFLVFGVIPGLLMLFSGFVLGMALYEEIWG